MGQGQKDIQGQPAQRCRRVELLRHRNKANCAGLELRHQAREIQQRVERPSLVSIASAVAIPGSLRTM
jgi:hypothetical protein